MASIYDAPVPPDEPDTFDQDCDGIPDYLEDHVVTDGEVE